MLRSGEGGTTNTGAGSGLRHVSRKGNVRKGVGAGKLVASAIRSLGGSFFFFKRLFFFPF